MLAVPTVPIEEDEMRRVPPVHLLVHAKEELDAGVRPALAERVESLDRHPHSRRLDPSASYLRRDLPGALPDSLARALRRAFRLATFRPAVRVTFARNSSPFLDFRHFLS